MYLRRLLSQVRSYVSVYYVLLKHFFRWNPVDAALTIFAVFCLAILYPLPLVLLARVAAMVLSGESLIELPGGYGLTTQAALVVALLSLLAVAVLQFVVEQHIVRRNLAWQGRLYKEFVSGLPRFARIDRTISLPLPIDFAAMHRIIVTATHGAMRIGRLISTGVRDAVMMLWTGLVLTYIDPVSMCIILLVSFAFLPIYASITIHMLTTTRNWHDILPSVRRQSMRISEQIASGEIAPSNASRKLTGFDSSKLYGLPNVQFSSIYKLRLLVIFQIVAVAAAVLMWGYSSDRPFTAREPVYLAILLVFLKSAMGLVSLMSRMMRAFPAMLNLRELIEPKRKEGMQRSEASSRTAREKAFVVQSVRGEELILGPGQECYVLMPPVKYAFELLSLSNAMHPLRKHKSDPALFIHVLEPKNGLPLEGSRLEPTESSETGMVGNRNADAVGPALEINEAFAFAVSGENWQAIAETPRAHELRVQKPILVCIAPYVKPEFPPEAKLIVSDGSRVLAIGSAEQLYDRYRERIAAIEKKPKVDTTANIDEDDAEIL